MKARIAFMAYVRAQLGKPALWGRKGSDAFDCSGLVTCGIKAAGGPDMRYTHRADDLHRETRKLEPGEVPLAGDLIFYDDPAPGVEHVGIYVTPAEAIDAEGATPRITSIDQAKAAGAKVKSHDAVVYRKHYRDTHRNLFLDALDAVAR